MNIGWLISITSATTNPRRYRKSRRAFRGSAKCVFVASVFVASVCHREWELPLATLTADARRREQRSLPAETDHRQNVTQLKVAWTYDSHDAFKGSRCRATRWW
jgi:hypothetical protein